MILNFKMSELIKSNIATQLHIDNMPNRQQLDNLLLLITDCLQPIRDLVGKPVIVTSGFRCTKLNKAVGGVSTSHHLLGAAADIQIKGMTPAEVIKKIENSDIKYTQLINEFNRWVHISYIPDNLKRQKSFTIN